MSDIKKFEELLRSKEKLVCMLAPSFVADFDYPEIVWSLKELGFDKVVELTFGAKMTNIYYHKVIKEDKTKTWIASPCPTIVEFIRNKYPKLKKNLIPVHSPVGSMSFICGKIYPKHKNVFIGPCLTKKVEIKELDEVKLALTFKELGVILREKGIDKVRKRRSTFDKFYKDYTKIYPLSGGLSNTLHYKKILKKNEILIIDGMDEVSKVFSKFREGKYKDYIFIDCLACAGGCIGGPGMSKDKPLKEKKKRVIQYRNFARRHEKDLGRRGKKFHVSEINFTRKF